MQLFWSTVFSGLGIFFATLIIEYYKDRKYKVNLLKALQNEVLINAERLTIDCNPMVGYYPIKNKAVDEFINNRIRYFNEEEELNNLVIWLDKLYSNGEKTWEFFRDIRLNKYDPEVVGEFTVESFSIFMQNFYCTAIFSYYNVLSILDKKLKTKKADTIIHDEWIKGVIELNDLFEMDELDFIKNPFISERLTAYLKRDFDAFVELAREIIEKRTANVS